MTAFLKMHGLGNDFVVIDARARDPKVTPGVARAIADRHTGIGCDQLIVIERPRGAGADAFMRIHNADGGEVEACGNAVRCVGAVLMDERGTSASVIETLAGPVRVSMGHGDAASDVTADMGEARLDWRDIPLAHDMDTLALPIEDGPLSRPVAVGMGNPHAVFFVENVERVPLAEIGPRLEHHPFYPKRANIEVVEVVSPTRLRVRVWERGAGLTLACGTGACAALVAAHRRNFVSRKGEVELDGGTLAIEWREDNHVLMTGPAALAFTGDVDLEAYG